MCIPYMTGFTRSNQIIHLLQRFTPAPLIFVLPITSIIGAEMEINVLELKAMTLLFPRQVLPSVSSSDSLVIQHSAKLKGTANSRRL